MKPHFRYIFSPGSVAFAVAAALAPGTVAGMDQPELETITIVARVPRAIAATDASVTVIDAARIDEQLAQDLRDLARYEPALSVRGDATRFGDESISIRGIGGNRVLVVIDGVPRPAAFAVGNFANAGRSLTDLDFVRRIEVLCGPASATHGSAAIGGVLAVETLAPLDLLTDAARHAARFRLQHGSDDHAWQGSALLAGRSAGLHWLGGVLRRNAGEVQNERRELDANPRQQHETSALVRLSIDPDTRWLRAPLQIGLNSTERHSLTSVDSLRLQPGRFANTIAMRGDDRLTEQSISLGQLHLDLSPLAQLEWQLFRQQLAVDQLTFEERRAVPPRSPAALIDRRFRYDASVDGLRLVGARDTATGRYAHRWSFGAEVTRQQIEERRDGLQTSLPTGVTTATILGEAFPLRDFPNSRMLEGGVFVFDEIRREGSLWSLSPALRIDHYRLTPQPDAIYRADNPTQVPVGVRETSLSPRLGVTFALPAELTAFGQYTHGFRSPPFEDVNIGLDLPQFLTRAIPNPDLRPERSDHVEVGLRRTGTGITGTASLYLARYRDFIESKVPLGRDPVSGYTIFQSRNRARARIFGGELALRAPLGADAGTSRWRAHFTAAWARGDDTAMDRPLNSIDPPRFTLGIDRASADERVRVSAVLNYAFAQDRIDESAGPLARAGGHATIDLLAGWQVRDGLDLRAALFNVLDRRHVEWADVRGRAATDPALDLYTRPGRSMSISLTLRLD